MPYFCSHFPRRKALKEAEEKAALEAKEAAENDFDIGKQYCSTLPKIIVAAFFFLAPAGGS